MGVSGGLSFRLLPYWWLVAGNWWLEKPATLLLATLHQLPATRQIGALLRERTLQ